MTCFHCQEEIGREELHNAVPFNSGTDFMHRECMLRTVIGSEDHIRRGAHPEGSCLPDNPRLSKREAALAAYRAWLACHQQPPSHVATPGTRMTRTNLPLDDSPCYGTVNAVLMLDLLQQLSRFPIRFLLGQPEEWTTFIFFKQFRPLRRRMKWN